MLSGKNMHRNMTGFKVIFDYISLNNRVILESYLWKDTNESNLYDWQYIEHITDTLKDNRDKGDYMAVIHTIRSNATRNLGNILDPQLYSRSYVGTKQLIERFQSEVSIDRCIWRM